MRGAKWVHRVRGAHLYTPSQRFGEADSLSFVEGAENFLPAAVVCFLDRWDNSRCCTPIAEIALHPNNVLHCHAQIAHSFEQIAKSTLTLLIEAEGMHVLVQSPQLCIEEIVLLSASMRRRLNKRTGALNQIRACNLQVLSIAAKQARNKITRCREFGRPAARITMRPFGHSSLKSRSICTNMRRKRRKQAAASLQQLCCERVVAHLRKQQLLHHCAAREHRQRRNRSCICKAIARRGFAIHAEVCDGACSVENRGQRAA